MFLSYCTTGLKQVFTVVFLPLYQMSDVKIAGGTPEMQLGWYPAPQLVSLIVCTEENCLILGPFIAKSVTSLRV